VDEEEEDDDDEIFMLQAIVATSAAVAFAAVGTSVVCVGHWVLSCVCLLIATDMCTKAQVGAKGSQNMLAIALFMCDAILLVLAKHTPKNTPNTACTWESQYLEFRLIVLSTQEKSMNC